MRSGHTCRIYVDFPPMLGPADTLVRESYNPNETIVCILMI